MHLARAITYLLLLLCSHLVFAKTNYKFYDAPQWVNAKQPNMKQPVPVDRVKDGTYYLLVDNQIQVSKTGEVATLNHYAMEIVNQNGIEYSSQLNIDFDPTYQKIILHTLQVWRHGKKIDKRSTARITLIQPEREANDLVYNGEQSLNIILDDIRVGDTIEYSYSRYGRNPVFGGRFDTGRKLQWAVPIGEIYQRIVWYKSKPLYFKRRNTDIEVKQIRNGDATEYIIETRNVPAISLDDATPGWFNPYASVYFSETQSWGNVVKWGQELFANTTTESPGIREVANKIKNDHSDKQMQIADALQYVQANVRYLGLEIGENSHRPTRPDVTLQRRYGDCKDKTALYIALLRELGITAYPALVNTHQKHKIEKHLPAYDVFNHVLVKVIYKHKHYWFDPTRQYQLGTIHDIFQPDYGYALVLKPGSKSLESMQQSNTAEDIVVNEKFFVDIKQPDKVKYEVKTTYNGLDAEYQRDRIASSGLQTIQKSYLDFYKNYYPGIKPIEPVKFIDKLENGALIGAEKYAISDFWENDQKNKKFVAVFYTSSISSYLKRPKRKSREYPYKLSYPASIEDNITVNFSHNDWSFPKENFTEENDFFYYKSGVFYEKETRRLHLNYVFKTKTNSVPAARYKEYVAALKRARDTIDYGIEYRVGVTASNSQGNSTKNWLVKHTWRILIAIYGFLTILGIVLWISADKRHPADGDTMYYPVSVPKFLFMWIMTVGMYSLYWFYKNYAYIKRRDGSSIMPIARSIFNIFWYYPLYKDLFLHQTSNHDKATIPPRYVGVILAVLFFVSSILSNREIYALFFFLLAGLSLLPLVNYIYHINDRESVDSRYNSKLAFRHVVLTFIFLPALLYLISSDTGLTASDSVIVGDKLYNYDLKYMQRKGILKPGEKIAYFYSDAFIFIRDDGNGFTERHVFSYWNEDGKLQVETASFDEIKDISVTWAKSFKDNTVVKIVRKDGSKFLLFVARAKGKDKVFVRELKRRWQQFVNG